MAVEFRGCRDLVYAEVTADTNTTGGYVTGTVKPLAPLGEISKTTATDSATKFYDNRSAIIIGSEGTDEVTFTIAVPTDEVLADITGRTWDATTKKFIESQRAQKYFAVGYKIGETGEGDDERYVWRYKGSFGIPDEAAKTADDSTDSSNMTLTYTGIYTTHEFTNGMGTGVKGAAKAMFMRPSSGLDIDAYFDEVSTPDDTFTA